LFWSDKGGDSIVLPEWVKNSVIAEPKFINAPRIDETFEFRGAQFLEMDFSDYDFKLKDDSPAIDAGVQVKLTEDLEKRLRPIGRMFDIGAFECF
jgi:hypothetical protein